MTTFTKEQLIDWARGREANAEAYPDFTMKDLALIEIALAAMQQEPVAWIVHARTGDQLTTDGGYVANAEGIGGIHSTALYASPSAPVVPDLSELEAVFQWIMELPIPTYGATQFAKRLRKVIEDCRAAMLQGNAEPVSMAYKLPETTFKPVADLYGITSPTGSETTFTFDAGEASSFADSGWSVQEYVELERYQEAVAGNSPVVQDWQAEAERFAELYGSCFVVFRNGEAPKCADPSKVIISFTDEGLGHHSATPKQKQQRTVSTAKTLTITLPDTSSKAFWSGTGKSEVFHPETYRRWVREAIERGCLIYGVGVEVK